jgi:hypothetical protein
VNVDGIEVDFEPKGEGRFAVRAEGRGLGSVELVKKGTGFVAYREDGEALRRPSQWGSEVTAVFATRELAARALLKR